MKKLFFGTTREVYNAIPTHVWEAHREIRRPAPLRQMWMRIMDALKE